MKIYVVTVHYAVSVLAEDEDEAQSIVENLDLPSNYLTGTFEIPDIHESAARP